MKIEEKIFYFQDILYVGTRFSLNKNQNYFLI